MKRHQFCVIELDVFFSLKVLENTPALLSLGKLCVKKRRFLQVEQLPKTMSHLKRDSDTMRHGELRSYRGFRLVNEFVFQFLQLQ